MSVAHLTANIRLFLRESAPNIRWLHLLNAGFDTLREGDLHRNTTITYSPGAGSTTVAEHGLALMLALARRLPATLVEQGRNNWDYRLGKNASSLRARTIMIYGFGHIGIALARLLQPFGMRVIAVNRSGRVHQLADVCCRLDDAETYLPEADYVAIAAPLTESTRHYFDAKRFEAFRPSAFLINLSRGGIVDLGALREALVAGKLAGAALDVTEPEPLISDHIFWSTPKVIITPHIAAAGANSSDREELNWLAAENTRRFVAGEDLLHVVQFSSD